MSNTFSGTGNLGGAPELKFVPIRGEQRAVASVSIFFDRRVPTDDPENPFEDKGGFWLETEVWGDRAERIAKQLTKGARVKAEGMLIDNSYEKDGVTIPKLKLVADDLFLSLARVENITFRKRAEQPEAADA